MNKQLKWTSQHETVIEAWQTQVVEAAKTPWLEQELMRREDVLLPRFAAHYTRLRALPRRVRRALQRKLAVSLAGAVYSSGYAAIWYQWKNLFITPF